jgi:hypothetical protein
MDAAAGFVQEDLPSWPDFVKNKNSGQMEIYCVYKFCKSETSMLAPFLAILLRSHISHPLPEKVHHFFAYLSATAAATVAFSSGIHGQRAKESCSGALWPSGPACHRRIMAMGRGHTT